MYLTTWVCLLYALVSVNDKMGRDIVFDSIFLPVGLLKLLQQKVCYQSTLYSMLVIKSMHSNEPI